MTFDSAVATDYGTALADLRDKVGGMANWSIKDDSSGGALTLAAGDFFVLTAPSGEDIRFYVDGGNGNALKVEYGPSWDATNNAWSDKYPANAYQQQGNGPVLLNNTNPTMSDSVTYWLEYVDAAGFGFYVERTQGDGNDSDMGIAFAELAKTWDYSTAASRESDYAFYWQGANYDATYGWDPTYAGQRERFNRLGEAGGTGDTHDGRGMVNPDANYSNYPYTDSAVASNQYKNSADSEAIVGTHDLFIRDESGGDSAHRDTIQDANGNNVYTILKAQNARLALRMD